MYKAGHGVGGGAAAVVVGLLSGIDVAGRYKYFGGPVC